MSKPKLSIKTMPAAAPRPCVHPGCGVLVRDGTANCARHPPNKFADAARGSRHDRGYGTEWDRLRKVVLRRDRGLCQVCKAQGRVALGNIVDHIRNKAAGGGDELSNLQVICGPCHVVKTANEARAGRAL